MLRDLSECSLKTLSKYRWTWVMAPKEMTIFTRRRKLKSSKGNKYLYKRYKTKYSALGFICPLPCSLRKGQVVPVQTKKAYGRLEITAQLIYNLRTRWRSAISLTLRTLCSRRNSWGSHYTGGLMGSKTDPDVDKTHVSCSCWVSKQGSSIFWTEFKKCE